MLALCDRVLDDTSTVLETPIRTYLHRYCRDYNINRTICLYANALTYIVTVVIIMVLEVLVVVAVVVG